MVRKIIVAFGVLIFIYSLFEVLRSFRIIQERFVSIFEGEIVSKVSLGAKEAVFKDDIAYASEVIVYIDFSPFFLIFITSFIKTVFDLCCNQI
jgi:hypothetical protein